MEVSALYLIVLPVALYSRAVWILSQRGYRVPVFQKLCFAGGMSLMAIALFSPIDTLGETDLLSAHMAQHLMIADLSAPLLLLGIRTPVYAFLLPVSGFKRLAKSKRLRRFIRTVKKPLVALVIWIFVLYGWHLNIAYEAALRNPWIHNFQHQSFIVASLLVWMSAIEPQRRRVPGELWKIPHILGARFAGMFLGMAFIATRGPIYDFYGDRALQHGLTTIEDQQLAGGMMLLLDTILMVGALIFFFFRSAGDADRAEEKERRRAEAQKEREEKQREDAEAGAEEEAESEALVSS